MTRYLVLSKIELTGQDKLYKRLQRLKKIQRESRLVEAWKRSLEILEMDARSGAPFWRGEIKADIDHEIFRDTEADEISGAVYTDVEYAAFQERGIKPVFPNIDRVTEWANFRDLDPYYVIHLIAEQGYPDLRYFEKAFTSNTELITDLIDIALVEILEKEY